MTPHYSDSPAFQPPGVPIMKLWLYGPKNSSNNLCIQICFRMKHYNTFRNIHSWSPVRHSRYIDLIRYKQSVWQLFGLRYQTTHFMWHFDIQRLGGKGFDYSIHGGQHMWFPVPVSFQFIRTHTHTHTHTHIDHIPINYRMYLVFGEKELTKEETKIL